MGVERDYLLYVIPAIEPSERSRPSSSTQKPSSGGLCWLTYPSPSGSSAQQTRRAAGASESEVEEPANADSTSVLAKFHSAPPSHAILNVVRENVVPFINEASRADKDDDLRWIIIWNDAAGLKRAKDWLDLIILPLLNFVGIPTEEQIRIYQSGQSGWEQDLIERTCPVNVIILGGDGTISDFLNQLFRFRDHRAGGLVEEKLEFGLVIVPLGTANAMFFNTHRHIKRLSRPGEILTGLLTALLEPTRRRDALLEASPPKLALTRVRTFDRSASPVDDLVSFVVSSTALHASILHTANQLALEPEHEASGIQIFKHAFSQNASKTWNATVKLFSPRSDIPVKRYNHRVDQLLIQTGDPQADGQAIKLEGPFSYFTSCLVDRLESKFVIAPLRNADGPDHLVQDLSSTMDVVVVRAFHQASGVTKGKTDLDGDNSRAECVSKTLFQVMQGAYQEGNHLKLLSDAGSPLVEYYRCGGWSWTPTDDNQVQHVCVDGKIIDIPHGGRVQCERIADDQTHILIY